MANTEQFSQSEQEKEPMLLLDTTGSMNYSSAANDPTPRKDVIREAISLIVGRLATEDSQAAGEEEEEGGGLRTITFADGQAHDIGDLNPNNLRDKWSQIHWRGGTRVMPGFNLLLKTYTDEFGSRPLDDRPLLLALVITDGEADDTAAFRDTVNRAAGSMYVVLAIIGHGAEHDMALRAYQQVEAQNGHVKVLPFAGETDPSVIANALLRMIE
ncbi:MAG TPA: vWA domain-containing protein [Ktedonobacteraceae bacterium]